MKIKTLLETTTPSSTPIGNNPSSAPKFGRNPEVLEDDKIEETTTSGSVATVSQPVGSLQKRGGNIFSGIKTSKKFPNSIAVKEEEINEQDLIINPISKKGPKPGFHKKDLLRQDHEVEMARSDLVSANKNSKKIYELIKDLTESDGIEGWVQEKIIKANDYLNSVREYLENKEIDKLQKFSTKSVAEGIRVVDQDYDLDQMILTLDIEGKKVSFTYWDYDENFANAERRDVFDQLQEQPWYAKLDHPTRMEILDAAYRAIRGLEPQEYRPTVRDEPLDEQGVAEGIFGDRTFNRVMPMVKRIASEVSDYDRDEFGEELWSLLDQKYGSKFAQSVLQDDLDFYWNEYTELTGKDIVEGSAQDKLHKRHQELRKKSGLPDPNYYKELKATFDLPDEERYKKAAELKKKYNVKETENNDIDVTEDLKKWFREKWVRFNPQGKIMGPCARGDDSEGKPKCLPQSKAHALGKKGRASAGARKRREDPNPERSGKAINVATKKKSNEGVAEGFSDIVKGVKRAVKGKEHPEVVASKHFGRVLGHYNQGSLPDAEKETKRYNKVQSMYKGIKTLPYPLKEQGVAEGSETNKYKVVVKGQKRSYSVWVEAKNEEVAIIRAQQYVAREHNDHGTRAAVVDMKQGVAEGKHPETWHDVDPKLGKAVDKMSQAEKVSKGFAHSDTLKKKTSFIQKLDAKLQQLGYTPTQEGNVYRWTSPTRQFVEVEHNTEDPGWYGWAEGQVTRSGKLNYSSSGNDSAKDIVAIFKSGGVFRKQGVAEGHEMCPECGGAMYSEEMINEKKDACYYKVKSRYKVWPSAYASGALVQCRKKGAKNWGSKSK